MIKFIETRISSAGSITNKRVGIVINVFFVMSKQSGGIAQAGQP